MLYSAPLSARVAVTGARQAYITMLCWPLPLSSRIPNDVLWFWLPGVVAKPKQDTAFWLLPVSASRYNGCVLPGTLSLVIVVPEAFPSTLRFNVVSLGPAWR